ncbi:hypothetical protein PTKIN_Ptkin02bG0001600 [Pterospermum kingtungense]
MATVSPPPRSSPPVVSPAPATATNPPPPPPSTTTSSPQPTPNSPPTSSTPSPSNANPPTSQSPLPPPPSQPPPPTSSPPSPAEASPPSQPPPSPRAASPTPPPSTSTSTSPAPPPPTPQLSPPPPTPQLSPPPAARPSPGPTQNPPPPPPTPSAQPPNASPSPQVPPTSPPINSSSPPPVNSPPASPPPRISPPPRPPPPSQSPPTTPPTSSPPPSSISPTPTPPSRLTPPTSQPTPSPSNSTSRSSPPPPTVLRISPPPPPRVSTPPSDNPTVDASGPSAPESSGSSGNDGIGVGVTVAIGVAVGIIVLSLIGLAVWCLRKQKKKHTRLNGGYVMPSPLRSSPRSDTSFTKTHSSAPLMGSSSGSDFVHSPVMPEPGGVGNSRPWFTYEELAEATNGFSDQNLLGEGGFGAVYKGCLPDGTEVAVKQLKIGGGQGEREFKAEVGIISRIHHRHLVSLVGYCISENQRLLIYDYVPNNTLYFHLHGENRPVLDWAIRVKIAAGAARGIAYLHEDCHPRIIHRDIKSSNILLDNNFEARVSDFGLAKLALDANTHVTTRVMGTFGYMAPEYASSGKLTEKSDVFSFGVVLLELITGRKPVDASQPLGDESLVEWARPLLSHALDTEDFEGLADPKLGRNYVESEMFRMIQAAAACVRHSAAKRPQMGQVVNVCY